MPLLGFVGFPPFAVECACTYRLLVWARLCPPLGDFTQQGPPRSKIFRTVIPLLALLFSHGVYDHMQRVTVTCLKQVISEPSNHRCVVAT